MNNKKETKVGKYHELAKNIIKEIGGEENVIKLHHCMTRLRFVLRDNDKANKEALEKMEGTVGVMIAGGQYQVIIGNHVSDVFAEILKNSNIPAGDEVLESAEKDDASIGMKIQRFMGAVMLPIIGVLAAAGVVSGLLALFSSIGVIEEGSGAHMIFDSLGNTVLHFFPIFVGYTAAKQLGMTPLTGVALGAALLHPEITNLPEGTTFLGINIAGQNFASTIIPILLLILIAAPFEKWLKKVIPASVRMFMIPMIILIVMFPLGLTIIGPFANLITDWLTSGIGWLFDASALLTGVVIAFAWQILVIFGVHHAVVMVMIAERAAAGPGVGIQLPVFMGAVSFAQTAVVFAIWLKTKDAKLKGISFPAWITGIFGITEPAIYGVTLPRFKFFLISCIAASVGAVYFALTSVLSYQPAGLGIFAIFGMINPAGGFSSVINWVIGVLIMIAVAFVATFILFKDDNKEEVKAV